MLGLGLGRFEGASQNADLSVLDALGHLGMREVLINNDTSNEGCVLQAATGLGNNLNVIEVDVSALEIRNMEDGLDS